METDYRNLHLGTVELNGDRFLLTIPSVQEWHEFIRYCTYKEEICNACFFERSCYVFEQTEEDSFLIRNSMLYEDRSDRVAKIRDGGISFFGTELLPALRFRPMLIPLSRNGEIDRTMTSMNGEMMDGGYLVLREIPSDGWVSRPVTIGCSEKPYQDFYVIPSSEYTVSVEETTTKEKSPLKWLVCNGMLVCTQAPLSAGLTILSDLNILPKG